MLKIIFMKQIHTILQLNIHGRIKLTWLCENHVYNHKFSRTKTHSLDLVERHSLLYTHFNKLSPPPKKTCLCHLLQWPLTLDICEKLTGITREKTWNKWWACDPWRRQICVTGHTNILQLGPTYLGSSSPFQHYTHSFQVRFPKY